MLCALCKYSLGSLAWKTVLGWLFNPRVLKKRELKTTGAMHLLKRKKKEKNGRRASCATVRCVATHHQGLTNASSAFFFSKTKIVTKCSPNLIQTSNGHAPACRQGVWHPPTARGVTKGWFSASSPWCTDRDSQFGKLAPN